ncbi:MAG TPA: hypothetical protein VF461_06565 [Gemmatimonadaceae bacterium]
MTVPVVALLIALAGPADSARLVSDSFPVRDTVPVQPVQLVGDRLSSNIPSRLSFPNSLQLQPDTTTPRRRRKAVQVSDWYERRLRIHRYLAYTTIPLYAFQAIAGNQLFQESSGAPGWAKTGHRVGATALAAVFTVNTVTGLWNLWDSRSVPQGRTRRAIHTILMLASDAGFTYTGIKLSNEAENSLEKRRQHRNLAYASMGVAIVGSGMMLIWRD